MNKLFTHHLPPSSSLNVSQGYTGTFLTTVTSLNLLSLLLIREHDGFALGLHANSWDFVEWVPAKMTLNEKNWRLTHGRSSRGPGCITKVHPEGTYIWFSFKLFFLSENINFDENIINFLAVKSNSFLKYELWMDWMMSTQKLGLCRTDIQKRLLYL